MIGFFFFSSRRRHTRFDCDWSSDVCSSDLDEWLAVHREAHRLGIPSNCTMLYGHVETMADRVDHLLALRALQDETAGFLTYIRSEEHTSELQSQSNLVCRLLLEKKQYNQYY